MLGQKINGEMVRLAREKRRMTQTELASASLVPQAAISRIENGERDELSNAQVSFMANSLNVPPAFFYQADLVYSSPMSLHSPAYRKKSTVSPKQLRGVVADGNHYVIHLRMLMDSIDLVPEFDLLQFEVVNGRDLAGQNARAVASATEAASIVRASWQVGDGPLLSLTAYIEASGVSVFHADFQGADVDGFTLRPIKTRPVIVLNKDRPADRMRFSLAHEYAHAVLHAFPYEAMEEEANEFAAALLMPKDGVIADLSARTLTLPYLGQLKLKWRVAISALIYRAREIGVISAHQATKLWIDMKEYRKKEPPQFDFAKEQTKLVPDLIAAHTNELGYSMQELAKALRTTPDEFARMHELVAPETKVQRPRLRLVVSRE